MLEKAIAKSLSVLLHPLVYPSLGFLLLFFFDNHFIVQINDQAKTLVFGIVFINTFLLPALSFLMLKRHGFVASLSMQEKEERTYPLMISFVFYMITWYLVNRLQISPIYNLILAVSILVNFTALLITPFFKISLHSLGAAAFSAAILSLGFVLQINTTLLFSLSLLLTGLIATSRMLLKAHSLDEVLVGLVLGFTLGLFVLILA